MQQFGQHGDDGDHLDDINQTTRQVNERAKFGAQNKPDNNYLQPPGRAFKLDAKQTDRLSGAFRRAKRGGQTSTKR